MQTLRLDKRFVVEDCCDVGHVSLSLKELCSGVVSVQTNTWAEEIRFSRVSALLLIAFFTLAVEFVFCGVSGNWLPLRAFVLADALVQGASFCMTK